MSQRTTKKPKAKPTPKERVIIRDNDPTEFNPNGAWRLRRTWLFSGDEHGNEFRYDSLGPGVVKCKETRSYAPAPTQDDGRDDQVTAVESRLATLTDDEYEVLRLQGKLSERVEQRLIIAAGDLVDYQRDGYSLVPGSAHEVERVGMAPVECVVVVGYEVVQVEQSSHGDIGERMGITPERVHSLVKSAMRKMRARQ